MPDPKPTPSTLDQASQGLSVLKKLVRDSQATSAPPVTPRAVPGTVPNGPPPPPTGPPPVDTSSIGGLLASFKDRVKYAMFGPPTPVPNPPK